MHTNYNGTAITNASGADISGNASHIANINPFRYRGYYYDTETGFYYLQTRYYDPIVGRFLNADAFVSTGQGILGNNMFAYCNNNPVMCCDAKGETPALAIPLLEPVFGWFLYGARNALGDFFTGFTSAIGDAIDGVSDWFSEQSRKNTEQKRKERERTYQETKVKNKMRETQEGYCLIVGIKDGYLHYLGGPYSINHIRTSIALDVLAGTNTVIPKDYTCWGFYTPQKSDAQKLGICFYPFFGCTLLEDATWWKHSMLPHFHTNPHEIEINGELHDIHFWYNN